MSGAPSRPRWRRLLRRLLAAAAALVLAAALLGGAVAWYARPPLWPLDPVVYGSRHGRDLVYHVLQPRRGANGRGVVFMVSGSWKSHPGKIEPWIVSPLLRRGYTVFAVCHLSQPQATVTEIVADVNRAVRHIRHHASGWAIDPDRLGASGGSSGGHLSLMLATRGGPGDPAAEDPVDRESSAVQAVAVFFPVTDLLNLGDSTENPGDGGPPKSFVKAFGPRADEMAVWKVTGRELSPIYHAGPNLPPVFILHGDADTLVPVDQSARFAEAARAAGGNVEWIVRRGKSHGWLTMVWDLRRFADWYDRHLF